MVAPYISTKTGAIENIEQGLALRFDSSASPILYVGEAPTGTLDADAHWRIYKVDTTSGVSITWADGSQEFHAVWNDRLTLSYS